MLKIDWNVRDGVRNGDAGLAEQISLPGLRSGMVDLKDAQAGKVIAVGKGVEPGSEQDILRYTLLDSRGERVFCVPRASYQESAQGLGRGTAGSAKLLSMGPKDWNGDGVVKDDRFVDALVRGTSQGDTEGGAGWAGSFHWSAFSISSPTVRVRVAASARKLAREAVLFSSRLLRRATNMSSLAFEDDRRSLMRRLAHMPEDCVAIRFDGSTTSAGELLHRLEDALLLPYPTNKFHVARKMPAATIKLHIAQLIGRFCDRALVSRSSNTQLRLGYQEISRQLREFGL